MSEDVKLPDNFKLIGNTMHVTGEYAEHEIANLSLWTMARFKGSENGVIGVDFICFNGGVPIEL